MNRRGFLKAMLGAAAAPLIYSKAGALLEMVEIDTGYETITLGMSMAEEMSYIMRRAFIPKMVTSIYRNSPTMAMLLRNAA